MRKLLLIATVMLLCACHGRQTQRASTDDCDTLEFRHATHLAIVHHKDFTEVRLADPWKEGRTLHTFLQIRAKLYHALTFAQHIGIALFV